MKRKRLFTSLLTAVMLIAAGTASADNGKERISAICAECHKNESQTIRGTLVPGSQKNDSFQVQAGKDIWSVRYDKNSKLNKVATVKDLPDEKAVKVRFRTEDNGQVYAEELSYKSNYGFKNPDDVISVSEVVELLKKDPKVANYVIFDSRGYDNFIEGHLPGAVLMPHYQFQAFKDRMPADKNTLIVAYCRGAS
ncbi:MAG: hypothetical protein HZA15_10155 [Nitrospirae bacterium]|nr:hypothetical protein [Nitrospirota bacterium]